MKPTSDIKDNKWELMYKCELCGSVFASGEFTTQQLAKEITDKLTAPTNRSVESVKQDFNIESDSTIHLCNGNGIGVARFVGIQPQMEYVRKDNDEAY